MYKHYLIVIMIGGKIVIMMVVPLYMQHMLTFLISNHIILYSFLHNLIVGIQLYIGLACNWLYYKHIANSVTIYSWLKEKIII